LAHTQLRALVNCCGWLDRRINPAWVPSNSQTNALRSKISTMINSYSKLPLEEPTEGLLLASWLALEKTLPVLKAAIRGNVRRIVGSLDEPLVANECCQQSCPLGRFAPNLWQI
jgi:hypothetical protein